MTFITLNNKNQSVTNFTNKLSFPIELNKLYEVALVDFLYKPYPIIQLGEVTLSIGQSKHTFQITGKPSELLEDVIERINDEIRKGTLKIEYYKRIKTHLKQVIRENPDFLESDNNSFLPNDEQKVSMMQEILSNLQHSILIYDKKNSSVALHIPEGQRIEINGPILQYFHQSDRLVLSKNSPSLNLNRERLHVMQVVHVVCDIIEDQNAVGIPVLKTLHVYEPNLTPQYKRVVMSGSEIENINIKLVEKLNEPDWNLPLGEATLVLHLQTLDTLPE